VERSAGHPPDRPRPGEAPLTPVPGPLEEEAPATRGELRSLRRWVAVAGVWAVAATAVAIIALLDEDGDDEADAARDSAAQVSRVQRELDRRLDDLEERVQQLPQSEDVRRLDNRLKEAEERSADASGDARRAGEGIDDLERRLDDLERQMQQQEGGGQTTTDEGQSP
jgi:DNA repair exonuclease SbcCD ATPase subunit